MKKNLIFSALVMSLFAAVPAKADPVPLEALLKELKVALVKVRQSDESAGLPKLATVTLNVATIQRKAAGSSFKLFVLEFGKKRTAELTTRVNIVLTPPESNSTSDIASTEFSGVLSEAILSAARAIKAAGPGMPALRPTEVKANIRFGVSQDASGKISLEFLPATPGLEPGVSESTGHEIVIVYKG